MRSSRERQRRTKELFHQYMAAVDSIIMLLRAFRRPDESLHAISFWKYRQPQAVLFADGSDRHHHWVVTNFLDGL